MEVKRCTPSYFPSTISSPKAKKKQAGDLRYENFKLFTKINPKAFIMPEQQANNEHFDFLKTAFGDSFPLITESKEND